MKTLWDYEKEFIEESLVLIYFIVLCIAFRIDDWYRNKKPVEKTWEFWNFVNKAIVPYKSMKHAKQAYYHARRRAYISAKSTMLKNAFLKMKIFKGTLKK